MDEWGLWDEQQNLRDGDTSGESRPTSWCGNHARDLFLMFWCFQVGFSTLAGSFMSSCFSDRIGLVKSVIYGNGIYMFFYFLCDIICITFRNVYLNDCLFCVLCILGPYSAVGGASVDFRSIHFRPVLLVGMSLFLDNTHPRGPRHCMWHETHKQIIYHKKHENRSDITSNINYIFYI